LSAFLNQSLNQSKNQLVKLLKRTHNYGKGEAKVKSYQEALRLMRKG